jgi:TonB family protein
MVAADRSMSPDEATYRKVQDLWRRKAAENPSNVDVLLHAAKFLERIDRSECLRLREAARAAAPGDPRPLNLLSGMWIGELFWFYNGSPEQNQRAAEALSVLLRSHDADVVGQVGLFMRPKDLQRLFAVDPQFQERFRASLRRQLDTCERLLDRAAQLDPQNPKWPEALREIREGLPAAPQRAQEPPPTNPEMPRRITVGGAVQQAMLLVQPAPQYRELARQARIEGIVRFSVVSGKEGDVIQATLISGHPLLVQSAMDAVRQYRYKPTLLNGQPVEVMTQVEVPFKLPD